MTRHQIYMEFANVANKLLEERNDHLLKNSPLKTEKKFQVCGKLVNKIVECMDIVQTLPED